MVEVGVKDFSDGPSVLKILIFQKERFSESDIIITEMTRLTGTYQWCCHISLKYINTLTVHCTVYTIQQHTNQTKMFRRSCG